MLENESKDTLFDFGGELLLRAVEPLHKYLLVHSPAHTSLSMCVHPRNFCLHVLIRLGIHMVQNSASRQLCIML